MYVLVATPTSPGSTPETSTFTDIDALWEHVKALKGYVEPPTSSIDSLGLSTENRYLKGILVDMYQRLDREFRGIKEGSQTLDKHFLGPSPFHSGVKKVPNHDIRQEPFKFDIKQSTDLSTLNGPNVDLSGSTVDFDPETSRLAYITDIFKPDIIFNCTQMHEIAGGHNSEEVLQRFASEKANSKPAYQQSKVELFQNLFLENFTLKTDWNRNYKETFFCWVLFVSSPQRFLTNKGIFFPIGLKDVLEYDRVRLHNSFESQCRKNTLNTQDPSFKVFLDLLKLVVPPNHKALPFEKQRSWEKICCDTLKTLYEVADGGKTKITADMLEPWIQFFLDAEIVGKKGQQIQSSVLFSDFCTYLSQIAKGCGAEALFQPLLNAVSIQHFSKTMKETYGIKTQRKAAGNFYLEIDYVKNGSGQGLTATIDAADFADLHREAKTESSWADAFSPA